MPAALALSDTLPGAAARAPGQVLARLVGVGKTYGQGDTAVAALTDATLDIRAGEVTLIEGPSGSGKTTLISILGLLLTPSVGQVWLDGQDVAGRGEGVLPALRARHFGFVFQGFNLFPALSALDNVALAIRMKGGRDATAHARRLLDQVGLATRMHHLPADLSGGQKQRVAIARALFNEPTLLLCDEPTGNLDSETGREVIEFFRELNAKDGVTLVIVTHERRVSSVAQRVIAMRDGMLVETSDEALAATGGGPA